MSHWLCRVPSHVRQVLSHGSHTFETNTKPESQVHFPTAALLLEFAIHVIHAASPMALHVKQVS